MVKFNISLEDHCPCESMRRARSCCFRNGVLKKTAANTTPPRPKTGRVVDGCVAAALEDCGGKLSAEHYVSKAVLEKLEEGEGAQITAHPLIPSANLALVKPSSLTARILCERHNNCLSELDTQAGRLFRALDDIAVDFVRYKDQQRNRVVLFNGHDIERWLLKTHVGLASIGTTFSVPISWLDVLFGTKSFEPEQGMYIPRTIGKTHIERRAVSLRQIERNGRLVGITVNLRETFFNLIMEPISGNRHFLGDDHAYRLFELHETDGLSEKSICFSWDGPHDGGTVHRSNTFTDDLPSPA